MNYRPYGKLGYDVSALGVGCMRFPRNIDGEGKVSVDLEKTFELIRYAVDHGVNYFDTAYSYHHTMSEAILGEALGSGTREKVRIATKQPFSVMKTQGDIRRNLENTLKKLRTDYIDVYLIHNVQSSIWEAIKKRGIIEEYEKFRAEGLIRAIGFSYHGGFSGFKDIIDYYPWDMCQIQQNLLDVDKEATAAAVKAAGEKGTALVIMEPLRGGGLAVPPPPVRKLYDSWDTKRSAVEWAFRHLINYPEVSCILSGVTTLEQLKENIEIFSKPDAVPGCLTEPEKEILAQAKTEYEALASIPCTGCEYCLPCPQGVQIPGVFSRYNEGIMFNNFNQPKRSYMFMSKAGQGVDTCAACGVCEKKCPQHIAVIDELKRSHEALKGWVE
ncbi:aldo/keto reductase [Breznakiella homolactica]|uniref:Aldo/keto reductase n=1 Tax=Breznakiella homolactica TaxID=2798577 RepID=A0A7T7XQX8_9SPIR|nr:aldo/keto reductase [Breznakiella homolactica]QQO10856.1 aldo/keto reductase [Breznakiella homolactica]